ncbi:MAG: CPBP family intramembrane metalloprotease [Synechococcaceae cyanobacterium RL_1_2]|nr:CPBP family intramembrane metalloprotease [Synechococcaceae cyanobacterium RL_1_2]
MKSYPAPLRLGIFLLTLLGIWLPIAIPCQILLQGQENLLNILAMGALFLEFLILTWIWGKYVYHLNLFKAYGWGISRYQGIELLQGLAWGISFTIGLLLVEHGLGLIILIPSQEPMFRFLWEGMATGLGVAWAEETLFRGWLWYELEQDYTKQKTLWLTSIVFATLHFLKPIAEIVRTWPTWPGLLLLALILGNTKRSHGNRLGTAIGLHGGMVWTYYIFNVGGLIQYPPNVSPWLTGIDQNPIAGLMGIMGLIILGIILAPSPPHP